MELQRSDNKKVMFVASSDGSFFNDAELPMASQSSAPGLVRTPSHRTTTTLSDKDLRRGTSTYILLECFGQRLRGTAGGIGFSRGVSSDDYDKSFVVQRLRYFLSHSWHANWFQKYLTLLFYFNIVPAMIACVIVGVGCLLLAYYDMLPWYASGSQHAFALGSGALAQMIVLLTWHRVNFFGETLFLDKVCIHQTDAKKKEEGIKSIGGILANSEKMLVPWDSSYFSRLWCIYEMSAFRHANPEAQIIIIPIHAGMAVFTLQIGTILTCVSQNFLDSYIDWFAMAWFVNSFGFTFFLRQYIDDLAKLETQLEGFTVSNAKCFCCNSDHIHPETGGALACDRTVVYESIAYWQGSDNVDLGLKDFDAMIRSSFKEFIRKSLGRSLVVPYYMLLSAGLFAGLDALDLYIAHGFEEQFRFTLLDILDWVFFPVPIAVCMVMILFRALAYSSNQRKCSKSLLSFGIAVTCTLIMVAWMFFQDLFIHQWRGPFKSTAWHTSEVLLLVGFYQRGRLRCCRSLESTQQNLDPSARIDEVELGSQHFQTANGQEFNPMSHEAFDAIFWHA